MAIEIKTDDVAVKARQSVDSDKVRPVQATRASQSLPGESKAVLSEGSRPAASATDIDAAVRDINEHMQFEQRGLQFSVDKGSGRTIIKVMDLQTEEIIRQIPSEEALNFARKLNAGENLELFSAYI